MSMTLSVQEVISSMAVPIAEAKQEIEKKFQLLFDKVQAHLPRLSDFTEQYSYKEREADFFIRAYRDIQRDLEGAFGDYIPKGELQKRFDTIVQKIKQTVSYDTFKLVPENLKKEINDYLEVVKQKEEIELVEKLQTLWKRKIADLQEDLDPTFAYNQTNHLKYSVAGMKLFHRRALYQNQLPLCQPISISFDEREGMWHFQELCDHYQKILERDRTEAQSSLLKDQMETLQYQLNLATEQGFSKMEDAFCVLLPSFHAFLQEFLSKRFAYSLPYHEQVSSLGFGELNQLKEIALKLSSQGEIIKQLQDDRAHKILVQESREGQEAQLYPFLPENPSEKLTTDWLGEFESQLPSVLKDSLAEEAVMQLLRKTLQQRPRAISERIVGRDVQRVAEQYTRGANDYSNFLRDFGAYLSSFRAVVRGVIKIYEALSQQ